MLMKYLIYYRYNVNLPKLSDFKMEDILDIIKENSLNRPKWGPVI